MYIDYHQDMYRQNTKLIADLEKAINGEYSAIQCYARLAQMAANEQQRRQIMEIREDEIKHFQLFSQFYTQLTGNQPQPVMSEECAKQYMEGLEAAIKDEQETVDFYLSVSDEATNGQIKEAFRRVAADEQNHAVWFLYFFTKLLK
ncbi:ferritin-like domain-containing protein [Bacillus testis]|uniref:ferritin-like domain-containing protein n=1 Tax=Bacillus testis TaxID=1622072 RepID=UPI00067EAC62|nr:ferritin-like domain-containing protein [Bacillus testis]